MKKIFVSKPYMPSIESYIERISKIWQSHVLTNNGALLLELESSLSQALMVKNLSIINNGTIALMIALKASEVTGRVITTPYSFVATANSILSAGLEPVFIDVANDSFNLDPDLIDTACSEDVSAIMPVHVYGIPCDDAAIQQRALELACRVKAGSIKVIYDAAHAFAVKKNGNSILEWGNQSVLSFHATKVFHTFEGGAIVCNDVALRERVDRLKSFGFNDQGDTFECGFNGKMNEAQAAMGLCLISHIDEILAKRKKWHESYCEQLSEIPSIKLISIPENVDYNYSYFPILIQPDFPITRDELYNRFCEQEIYPRKYFYPLITDFSLYKDYKIISKHKTSNARRIAETVLCLPLYPDLTENDVSRVCDVIKNVF